MGLSVLLCVGCTDESGSSRPPKHPGGGAIATGDDALVAGDGALVRVEDLYGKYRVSDHGSSHGESSEWAIGIMSSEAAILPEVFAMRGIVILRPRYELRRYERPVEGEVPTGIRRRLTDFHGIQTRTGRVTVLHVYEAGAPCPRWHLEVIDANTLWDTAEGLDVLQWRREGTGKHPIPLKQRLLRYDGNGKTE